MRCPPMSSSYEELKSPFKLNLHSSNKTEIGKCQSLFLFWGMIAKPLPVLP
jgi:hypothetical protein